MITSYNGKAEIERLGAKCFDVGVLESALQRERRNGFVIAILCVPNEDLKNLRTINQFTYNYVYN